MGSNPGPFADAIGTWNWNSGEYGQGTSADILPTNWTDDQIDTMC